MESRRINIFMFLIFGVMPIIIIPSVDDRFYEPKIYFIYFICIAMLLSLKNLNIKYSLALLDKLLICYGLILLLSTVFSIDVFQSLVGREYRREGLIAMFFYIVIFFIMYKHFNYSQRVKDLIFIFVVFISIYCLMQYYGLDFIPKDHIRNAWKRHPYATIGNRNFVGSYLILFFPMALMEYISNGRKKYFFVSTVIFAALISTYTRSAWLAFFVEITVILYYSHDKKEYKRRYFVAILAFLFTFATMDITTNNDVIKRVLMIKYDTVEIAKDDGGNAGSGRIYIWEKTIPLIIDNPILGTGPDTLAKALKEKYKTDDKFIKKNNKSLIDKAHNEYLQIAATTGIPSLAVYLIFLAAILSRTLKAIYLNNDMILKAVFCSILGYLIQAFFNISVVGVAPIFWALLGIAANLSEKMYS